MLTKRQFLNSAVSFAALGSLAGIATSRTALAASSRTFEVTRTEAEWKKSLTPEQFAVLRKHSTERAGSSPLDKESRKGVFHCGGCDLAVYDSGAKYDSGTGWPSFYSAIDGAIGTLSDNTLFISRTEIHCRRCGGHLGHLFDDGPKPTGKRHCLNGVALLFRPAVA